MKYTNAQLALKLAYVPGNVDESLREATRLLDWLETHPISTGATEIPAATTTYIPAEVTEVRDNDGDTWYRCRDGVTWSTLSGRGRASMQNDAWLMRNYGPLEWGTFTTHDDSIPANVDKVWDRVGDIWLRVGRNKWLCDVLKLSEMDMVNLYGPVTTQPKGTQPKDDDD